MNADLTFQAPAACKILKCASVLTEASCILEAITDDSISEAFECITKKTVGRHHVGSRL